MTASNSIVVDSCNTCEQQSKENRHHYQLEEITPSDLATPSCTSTTCLTTPLKIQRSISFAPFTQVHPIRHVGDYSDEEKRDTWYSGVELSRVKGENAATIYQMTLHQQGIQRFDNAKYCARGLEHRTPVGVKHRQRHKHTALDAVLSEQDAQWDQEICDEDAIASVYMACSSACQMMAYQLGLLDECIAQRQFEQEGVIPTTTPPPTTVLRDCSKEANVTVSAVVPKKQPLTTSSTMATSLTEHKKRKLMCPTAA